MSERSGSGGREGCPPAFFFSGGRGGRLSTRPPALVLSHPSFAAHGRAPPSPFAHALLSSLLPSQAVTDPASWTPPLRAPRPENTQEVRVRGQSASVFLSIFQSRPFSEAFPGPSFTHTVEGGGVRGAHTNKQGARP